MRLPGKVIPSRHMAHKNGMTASCYGAAPWTGAPNNQESDWTMVVSGYTISWADGTVGVGRKPFATQAEAQAYLDTVAKLRQAV